MSEPTEVAFALIKVSSGGSSPTYAVLCGIRDVTINRAAASNDYTSYDCAKPNAPGLRKQRISSKSLDISGSGLTNADTIEDFEDALGVLKDYHVELYADDGSDTGDLLGTYAYSSHMTAANMNLTREGQATADITLPAHGAWTYTPAS